MSKCRSEQKGASEPDAPQHGCEVTNMAKDPAVLFYTADFIVGTITMNHEQRGKYITLLCLQHQKGHLTESEMRNVCGEYDEAVYSKFVVDEEGLYYNERMDTEVMKRAKGSDASRRNGEKGGRPPGSKTKEPTAVIEKRFDEFWDAYPRKVGKAAALKKWIIIRPSADLHSQILEALAQQKKSAQWKRDGGQYIPHPTTWLNQGRWDDEPLKDSGNKGTKQGTLGVLASMMDEEEKADEKT